MKSKQLFLFALAMSVTVFASAATHKRPAHPAGPKQKETETPESAPRTSEIKVPQQCLAIVSSHGGDAVGTGFVVEMDGKKYLVTNEHITRAGLPWRAQLLGGASLDISSMSIAEDEDLVRFELAETNLTALAMATGPFDIGQEVGVFGNSDGGGVMTGLRGKILGVGPDRIEISAPFVHGNSGSPIVDEHARAIGVATYAEYKRDPSDWVKEGTRFTGVRRYGLLLAGVKWKKIGIRDYAAATDILDDMERCNTDLLTLLQKDYSASRVYSDMMADDQRTKRRYTYSFDQNKAEYKKLTGLCQTLSGACEALSNYDWNWNWTLQPGFAMPVMPAMPYGMGGSFGPKMKNQSHDRKNVPYCASNAARADKVRKQKDEGTKVDNQWARLSQTVTDSVKNYGWPTTHIRKSAEEQQQLLDEIVKFVRENIVRLQDVRD